MKFADLELAFEFHNDGDPYDHVTYISRSTGRTYICSEMGGDDELPEDVEENDDYVEIPHKYDLDLGKELVWEFVDRQIPGLKNKVQGIFSRRGAYGLNEAFLANLDLLDAWHRFEDERRKEALLTWCKDAGISIEE